MNTVVSIEVDWKVVMLNAVGFAILILFFVLLGSLTAGSGSAASFAQWITMSILAVLLMVLGWQLGRNRAVLEGPQLVVKAGFYQARWPASILEQPWSEHDLCEFHRDNGVRVYGYAAGYYSRGGRNREFMLAIGANQVRCFALAGFPGLCLDAFTHEQILAVWQGGAR